MHEVRKDPSFKFYDHKSNSSGVRYISYVALNSNRIVWIHCEHSPAGDGTDLSFFKGGRADQNQDKWDWDACFFHIPEGEKAIGDSINNGELLMV